MTGSDFNTLKRIAFSCARSLYGKGFYDIKLSSDSGALSDFEYSATLSNSKNNELLLLKKAVAGTEFKALECLLDELQNEIETKPWRNKYHPIRKRFEDEGEELERSREDRKARKLQRKVAKRRERERSMKRSMKRKEERMKRKEDNMKQKEDNMKQKEESRSLSEGGQKKRGLSEDLGKN